MTEWIPTIEGRTAGRVANRSFARYWTSVWQLSAAGTALALFIAVAMVIPSAGINVFNTPDETSNHLFTKTFAESGRLWYTKEYTALDEENLLHPRGAITQDDRVVPYSYLGVPIVYGLAYRLLGDSLVIVAAIVLATVSAWALYRACNLLFGAKAWEVWGVSLGFTPLLYYLNRPYMNAAPAIAGTLVSVWLFARYFRSSRRLDLLIASIGAAVTLFFRYEYVLFLTPMALWAMYVKHGTVFGKPFLKDALVFFGTIATLFVLPIALLNQWTYGHWSTYGPSLFGDVYFPERISEGSWLSTNLTSLRKILLPSYPFNPLQVLQNVPRLVIWLMPALTIAASMGVVMVCKCGRLTKRQLLLVALVAGYMLTYLGSGETYLTSGDTPTFNAAVVRYWLPFYTIVFFLAVFGVVSTRDMALKVVLVAGIVVTGPMSVYSVMDGSLERERLLLTHLESYAAAEIEPFIEQDAVIYAGQTDKRIIASRDVATWWPGGGAVLYDPSAVAASMARMRPTGRPLYIFKEREVDIPELNRELAAYDLRAAASQAQGFYKIEALQ